MDSLAGMFFAGGFPTDLTHHVMHVLGNRMGAFSPELFEEPRDPAAQPPSAEEQAAMAAEFGRRFPHILEIAMVATRGDLSGVGGGCDERFESEVALACCSTGSNGCACGAGRPATAENVNGPACGCRRARSCGGVVSLRPR